MIYIDDANTISIVCGNYVSFTLTMDNYLFQVGDKAIITVREITQDCSGDNMSGEDSDEDNEVIGDIVLQAEAGQFADNMAMFGLDKTQTDLTPGYYYYDITLELATGVVDTVISATSFIVLQNIYEMQ